MFACFQTEPAPALRCIDTSVVPSWLDENTGRQPVVKPPASGTVRTAGTAAAVNAALAASSPGDQVKILPGSYTWGSVSFSGGPDGVCVDGTEANFTGTQITLNSALTLWGGNFINNDRRRDVVLNASNAKVIATTHIGSGDSATPFGRVIEVFPGADDTEIAHTYIDSPLQDTFGISVGTSTTSAPLRAHVHHNTLVNSQPYNGTQGGAVIRLGLAFNQSDSLVELNRIENWNDDPETIEVKTSGNRILNNLILGSPRGHISNRQGDDNIYYGNYSDGSIHGIRISGYDNVSVFNYTKATPTTNAMALRLFNRRGNPPWNSGSPLPEKDAMGNNISCNVFESFIRWAGINDQGAAPFVNGPTNNTIADNYYLDHPDNVEQASGYLDDNGTMSHAQFMAENTVSGNQLVEERSASVYCLARDQEIKREVTVDGQSYTMPVWMEQMLTE